MTGKRQISGSRLVAGRIQLDTEADRMARMRRILAERDQELKERDEVIERYQGTCGELGQEIQKLKGRLHVYARATTALLTALEGIVDSLNVAIRFCKETLKNS